MTRVNITLDAKRLAELDRLALTAGRSRSQQLAELVRLESIRHKPFRTTPEQLKDIPRLANTMHDNGVPTKVVWRAWELARDDQGLYDLMWMWCSQPTEREATLQAIKESIADHKKAFWY